MKYFSIQDWYSFEHVFDAPLTDYTSKVQRGELVYSRVSNVATKLACTPPQLALVWLHNQGDDIIPIPGTTKVKNLDDNIGCLALKLTEDNLKEIRDAVPIDEVGGDRNFSNLSEYRIANTPRK
ncbi:hypothetical protein ACOSP7_007724 [Xanthoceras sorbifolium]